MSLFRVDNPVIQLLGKLMQLVLLNLLMLLCSLPVVTIGAAITAGHYTALKIRRNEGYVLQNFWNSFKENLLQATVLWIVILVNAGIAFGAYRVAGLVGGTVGSLIMVVIIAMFIVTLFCYMWLYPLLSKFRNTIWMTMKNAYILSFRYLFRTLYMVMVTLIPIILLEALTLNWYIALFLLFGLSLPTYWSVLMYDKVFESIESAQNK